MEPIPYFFESIDRNAIIIKPKKPFFDWVNSVLPDDDLSMLAINDFNVYLIRSMDSIEEIYRYVELNFDMIFVNELNDWYVKEETWPANRTFKMFSDWFEVEVNSVILDLEEYEITKE